MKNRYVSPGFVRIGLAATLAAAAAFAADAPPASTGAMPSKEMREKMAVVHEQMAACLRSDKPIADCRTEAMQKCHQAMGQQGCQGMGMGHGMGMGNMSK